MSVQPSFFQRFILPGFAFKAVVIGGGYATGRELVQFFFPGGPLGGLAGIALTMVLWSAVCSLTFVLAQAVDLSAHYTMASFGQGEVQIFAGVDNVFDKDPPVVPLNFIANAATNGAIYDVIGRKYFVGARMKF